MYNFIIDLSERMFKVKRIELGKSGLKVSAVAVGCMRMANVGESGARELVEKALELGLNFFDHADIYGGGECESIFSRVVNLTPSLREKMIIQSKCGIVPGVMYDFSYEHIVFSVEKILKRLNTDYLDVLVLHRPDALVEPEKVARAFDELHNSGKVHFFGVSNYRPSQIELLKKYVKQPIIVNQLQFSITNSNMIASGLEVNMTSSGSFDHDGSVLDYCRLNDITVQAWSPFQYGMFEGCFIGNEKFPELNKKLDELAEKYNTSSTAIAAAWILRHPANMQLISGTMNPQHLAEIADGMEIELTREEWYSLYLSAGHILP